MRCRKKTSSAPKKSQIAGKNDTHFQEGFCMQHSGFSNDCHPPSTAATKVLWVSLSDKWNTSSTNFPLIFNKISQKTKLHSPKSKNGCLEDGFPFEAQPSFTQHCVVRGEYRMKYHGSTMVPIACPIMSHMSMRAF